MKYMFVAVDYVLNWVEVIVLPNNEGKSVTAFLKMCIFYIFRTSPYFVHLGLSLAMEVPTFLISF